MSGRERFFLALAAVGFIVPNPLLLIFSARHGIDLGRYPTPVESPPIALAAA
jgi:hypothetical protein